MPWFAGVERAQINWSPTIDAAKCVSCGVCMNCGKKVFAWEDGKSKVVNPTACVVGCSTCANLCQGEAVSFPPLSQLRAFYKEHKIWPKVRRAMEESRAIPRRSRIAEPSA